MLYKILAEFTVLLHFLFILFVILGGLAAIKWRKLIWYHLPAATWGALIEFAGWICPLTPLEQWLRYKAELQNYSGGFIDHYLIAIIYPTGLTREIQFILGGLVILINLIAYSFYFRTINRVSKHS
jgi:hypothetical protein